MGYNLHPSIPTSSSELKIADIGTGTGFECPKLDDSESDTDILSTMYTPESG